MLGCDVDFALNDAPSPEENPTLYGEVGLAVGFGVGTGQQVMPPLDNDQISDKGFLAQVSFGLEHRFSRAVALGVRVPVTFGQLSKNDAPANVESSWYQSVHVMPMLNLEILLGWK